MGSHHDDEHSTNPEMIASVRKLFEDMADQMTAQRLNTITAGKPGETPLYKDTVGGMLVTRMPDDPLALRISIGDPHDLDEGMYCVFRGLPSKAIALLERALEALKSSHEPGPKGCRNGLLEGQKQRQS